jgi:hypothetical protein
MISIISDLIPFPPAPLSSPLFAFHHFCVLEISDKRHRLGLKFLMRKIAYSFFARPDAYYLQLFNPFCAQAGKFLKRSEKISPHAGKLSKGVWGFPQGIEKNSRHVKRFSNRAKRFYKGAKELFHDDQKILKRHSFPICLMVSRFQPARERR